MSTSKYSIILPVRNGGEYVKLCVDSILSQTLPGFTLHVLDNCSTDGTLEWLQSVKDKRLALIQSSKPLSIEASWQRVVSIPKNEWMTLIGHDDLLYPHYLQTIDDLIKQHPNASLYQTHFNLIDSSGKFIRSCQKMAEVEDNAAFLQTVLRMQVDVFGTGYMMRSKDYEALGGIPDYSNLLFADFELWMNLTGLACKATSPVEAFSYRLHQSTTKQSPDVKMLSAFERFIYYLMTLKKKEQLCEIIENEAPYFIHKYAKGLAHRLLRSPIQSRNNLTVAGLISKMQNYIKLLVPHTTLQIKRDRSIQLALLIDGNPVLRQLFLLFKKLFPKPVLK